MPSPETTPSQDARRNAFLYCKFRDQQFAAYDAYAKGKGILMKTFLVLNALFYAEDGLSQRQICQRVLESKQTVSLIVKNLARDGSVVLEDNPTDRRTKVVKLTEAGRAFAEGPVRHITRAEDTAMGMLTEGEQEQLVALSRKFTANLIALVQDCEDDA